MKIINIFLILSLTITNSFSNPYPCINNEENCLDSKSSIVNGINDLNSALEKALEKAEEHFLQNTRCLFPSHVFIFFETWGDASLGFDGSPSVAGSALSTAATIIFVDTTGTGYVYFNGKFAYTGKYEKMREDIKEHCMKPVSKKDDYN